ncbi:MAG: polysaccharide biosynthesis protein [Bdellovibrionota bacterium]
MTENADRKVFGDALAVFSRRTALWSILLFTVSLAGLALALALRFDFSIDEILLKDRLTKPLLILVFCRAVTYWQQRILRTAWKHFGTYDALLILKAHVWSSVLFTAGLIFFRVQYFPRSVVITESIVSLGLIVAIKLALRLYYEKSDPQPYPVLAQKIAVIGAGDSGHRLIRMLQGRLTGEQRIVAVFDDNSALSGSLVHGIKVAGKIAELPSYLGSHPDVHQVVIAVPSLPSWKTEQIIKTCVSRNVQCRRIKDINDLAIEDFTLTSDGPDLFVELLMEKELFPSIPEQARAGIAGMRLLITGGGGSIGSELVRQLCDHSPKEVVVLDNSEFNLFKLENELRLKFPQVEIRFVLADIRDVPRMKSVMQRYLPDIVYHAAAYKHVPITEQNPHEAYKTNVLGTLATLELSYAVGSKRFVMISTDKAVDPMNILGLTKRLAELLVSSMCTAAREHGKSFPAASVRFGNVINSTGSAIPTFRAQILQGLHVTVTHPDAERYFMTTSEAAQLVICAGTLGQKGEIFALDMGRKVKIVDVAERMKALLGRRDLPIVFTGLRPGERLSEEITAKSELAEPTVFPKVMVIPSEPVPSSLIERVKAVGAELADYSNEKVFQTIQDLIAIDRPAAEANRQS